MALGEVTLRAILFTLIFLSIIDISEVKTLLIHEMLLVLLNQQQKIHYLKLLCKEHKLNLQIQDKLYYHLVLHN